MKKTVVRTVGLSALLMLVSTALSQQPADGPKKGTNEDPGKKDEAYKKVYKSYSESLAKTASSSLENRLSQALQNNPDIKVAEAKLREAEAEMNRTRMLIAQKVITLHHSIEAQREVVKFAQTSYDRLLRAPHHEVSAQGSQTVESTLSQEKAKLAALEADMPTLLGKLPQSMTTAGLASLALSSRLAVHGPGSITFSPDGTVLAAPSADGSVRLWDAATGKLLERYGSSIKVPSEKSLIAGDMADKIRKALDRPIPVSFRATPLAKVFEQLQVNTGINFTTNFSPEDSKQLLTLEFATPVALGAVLQAIEDSADLIIVVREYGLNVAKTNPLQPKHSVPLYDFWKGHVTSDKTARAAAGSAVAGVEGTIKTINHGGAGANTYLLSIGSESGLRLGQKLDVYRLKPEPKYLGTIEIQHLTSDQAVAGNKGGVREPLQLGDRVSADSKGN